MTYFRSVLVGILVAFISAVLWIVAVFVLPIAAPVLLSHLRGVGGAAGASVGSDSILLAGALGFVVGFAWDFRKQRARRRRSGERARA